MLPFKPLIKGLLTWVPGAYSRFSKKKTGGTVSATYCYGVWMKHLTFLYERGLRSVPNTVAELGPGDSLGVGLCALLSGANHYIGLDAYPFAAEEENLRIFKELVSCFKKRKERPRKGWPDFDSYLDRSLFPGHILSVDHLEKTLSEKRLLEIENAIKRIQNPGQTITIEYHAPWQNKKNELNNSIDLLISHSVMEHVVDIEDAYSIFKTWIKPGGWMTHQIDFNSHGITKIWNAYWKYPEWIWKLILGKRPFLINREPCSKHLNCIESNGFEPLTVLKRKEEKGIGKEKLAPKWENLSDEDLKCSGLFVQSRRLENSLY